MTNPRKVKAVKAWAYVGSHGGIFAFGGGGQCATNYRGMMHIYTTQVTPDLVPVLITPIPTPKRKLK